MLATATLLSLGPSLAFGANPTPDPSLSHQWCFWLHTVETLSVERACGLPRNAVDDAAYAAVGQLETFIIAKSAQPPITASEMAVARKAQEQHPLIVVADGGQRLLDFCAEQNAYLAAWRQQSVDDLDRAIGFLTGPAALIVDKTACS